MRFESWSLTVKHGSDSLFCACLSITTGNTNVDCFWLSLCSYTCSCMQSFDNIRNNDLEKILGNIGYRFIAQRTKCPRLSYGRGKTVPIYFMALDCNVEVTMLNL